MALGVEKLLGVLPHAYKMYCLKDIGDVEVEIMIGNKYFTISLRITFPNYKYFLGD